MAVSYLLFLIQACRTFQKIVVLLLCCKHGSALLSLFCNLNHNSGMFLSSYKFGRFFMICLLHRLLVLFFSSARGDSSLF